MAALTNGPVPVVNLAKNTELSKTARASRRFGVGDAYSFDDEIWLFRERLPGGFLLFQKPSGEVLRIDRYDPNSPYVTEDWVDRNIAERKFRRVDASRGGEPLLSADIDRETAVSLDPKAPFRKALMEAIDRHGARPSRALVQAAINSMAFSHPVESAAFGERPAYNTVRHWLSERGSRGSRPWSACISLQGKVPRCSRLASKPLEILTFDIAPKFWADPLMTMATAFALMVEAVEFYNAAGKVENESFVDILPPSRSTMWRHILSYACLETYTAKFGKKKAERRFKATGCGRRADKILQLCMMDHTVLDMIIVDQRTGAIIGRPIITVLICVYSRCILGYYLGFNPAGLSTVIACLKGAFRQKLDCIGSDQFPILQDFYGRPAKIIVDNGLEFVSRSILDVSADLGIGLEACPVKEPTYKAIVERFFGILNSMGVHSFPGTTLNKQKKLLTEYDSMKDACFTIEQARELIDRTLYLYHIEGHRGLNGQPPALLWQRDAVRNGIPEYTDPDALDVLMGVSDERSVQRDGIEIHGLQYHNKSVIRNFLDDYPSRVKDGQKFKIKYDPENIGTIRVYHPKNRKYYELQCTNYDYAVGLSLFAHVRIEKHATAEGLAFSTLAQRCHARTSLYHTVNRFQRRRARKNAKDAARIAGSAGFQEKALQKGAVQPLVITKIPQDTFLADREDGGALAKIPRRGGAKAEKTRKQNLKRTADDQKSLDAVSKARTPARPEIHDNSMYEGY